jgi:hypothetical protein
MHCIMHMVRDNSKSPQYFSETAEEQGIPTVEKLPKPFTMEDEEYASKDGHV